MRKIISAFMLAAALGIAIPALAHDVAVGPNGGQLLDAKGHHLELVVKGAELTVYVSDSGHAPTTSKGASGRAVIQAGKDQRTVLLEPREPNILAATLPGPLAAGARVVVSAKLGGGQDLLARFVTK